MNSYMAKNVKCPYYNGEKETKLHCKSWEDGLYVHIVFKSPSIRRDFQLDKCCNDYKSCPLCQINDKVWEERL